jgi:hypothetical protein
MRAWNCLWCALRIRACWCVSRDTHLGSHAVLFVILERVAAGSSEMLILVGQKCSASPGTTQDVYVLCCENLHHITSDQTWYQRVNRMLYFHEVSYRLSIKGEFRANRRSDRHTTRKGINKFLPVISVFLERFWWNLVQKNLRFISSCSCEFHEKPCSKNRTLLKGVNNILPIFPTFSPRFGKHLWRCPSNFVK